MSDYKIEHLISTKSQLISENNEYENSIHYLEIYPNIISTESYNTKMDILSKLYKDNKDMIANIDGILDDICEHEWENDYIEKGPDDFIVKITICNKCHLIQKNHTDNKEAEEESFII